MKDVVENIFLVDDVLLLRPITLQPGWYQYMVFEHQANILAHVDKYIHGLILGKKDSYGNPHAGGLVFVDMVTLMVVTSGAHANHTRHVYKLFNLEVREPTEFTIIARQKTGGDDKLGVHFKYSEKKLLEVI